MVKVAMSPILVMLSVVQRLKGTKDLFLQTFTFLIVLSRYNEVSFLTEEKDSLSWEITKTDYRLFP